MAPFLSIKSKRWPSRFASMLGHIQEKEREGKACPAKMSPPGVSLRNHTSVRASPGTWVVFSKLQVMVSIRISL